MMSSASAGPSRPGPRAAAAAPSQAPPPTGYRPPTRSLKQPMTLGVTERPMPGQVAAAAGVSDAAALRTALERRATAARRAEKWMDKAMEEVLNRDEFQKALSYMHAAQYTEVQHERHLNGLCSYPLCGNAPAAAYRSAKRFVVSTAKRTITETDGNADEGFCSRRCAARAHYVAAGLGTEATWLRGTGARVQLLEEREERGDVRWAGRRGDVLEWVKSEVAAVGNKTSVPKPSALAAGAAWSAPPPPPPPVASEAQPPPPLASITPAASTCGNDTAAREQRDTGAAGTSTGAGQVASRVSDSAIQTTPASTSAARAPASASATPAAPAATIPPSAPTTTARPLATPSPPLPNVDGMSGLIAALSIVERETPRAKPQPPSKASTYVEQGRIVGGGQLDPQPAPAPQPTAGTTAAAAQTRRQGSSMLSAKSQTLASVVLAAAKTVTVPVGEDESDASEEEEDWAREMGWGEGEDVDRLFEEARLAREMGAEEQGQG